MNRYQFPEPVSDTGMFYDECVLVLFDLRQGQGKVADLTRDMWLAMKGVVKVQRIRNLLTGAYCDQEPDADEDSEASDEEEEEEDLQEEEEEEEEEDLQEEEKEEVAQEAAEEEKEMEKKRMRISL